MWTPKSLPRDLPRYLALADRIAEDIASGRLQPGMRLPPQRDLAARLGVDFTTISRGYAEARRRGLIVGHVGRGTFVRPTREGEPLAADRIADRGELVDMSLNLPPGIAVEEAGRALAETLGALRAAGGLSALLDYQPNAGRLTDRAAGAEWVARRLGAPVAPERIVICGGAQHALTVCLLSLANPGDIVATEALTYPGFRALAEQLHLRVEGVEIDEHGIRPRALRELCRRRTVRALYCTPTLHNPTTAVMPIERRRKLARVAEEFGVAIIEDDVYGTLATDAPPPLSSLAPAQSYFVASLSKAVASGLRIAYLLAPDARTADRLAAAVRATTWMATPLTAEIASRWILDGTAERVREAVRAEVRSRQRLARSILAGQRMRAHPEGFHIWLELPPGWSSAELVMQARRAGVAITPSDAFAVGSEPPPAAVRLSLGAARTTDALERALRTVARLLEMAPRSGL
jgi:DNA-binding transcriptional MocR family regulator